MTIRKFKGPDVLSVMRRIKRELGEDAVIVSTSKVIDGGIAGFFGRQAVEIVACCGEEETPAGRREGPPGINLTIPREMPGPIDRAEREGPGAGPLVEKPPAAYAGESQAVARNLFKPLTLTASTRIAGEEVHGSVFPEKMVFIGLSGAGKTTCVGRVARELGRGREVLVVSLEEEGRLSGAVRWEEVWMAMGVRFEAVMEMKAAARLAAGHDGPVLVDTPPITIDGSRAGDLFGLARLEGFSVCLVVDSHLEAEEASLLVEFLRNVGVDIIMLTKTDELLTRDRVGGLAAVFRDAPVFICESPLVTSPPVPFGREGRGELSYG